MTAKRRKKWNRRILIAETLLTLHLTYVRSKRSEVWFCMADIQDLWNAGVIPSGLKRSSQMTNQELSNRLKTIWALNCVETEYRDYPGAKYGLEGKRKRQVYFRVTCEEQLKEYISDAKASRESLL